jgi:hypothetical protein
LSTRRLKIEVHDGEGNKITVSFKGQLTRNKVLHILDFVELLGGVSSNRPEDGDALSDLSKFEKLQLIVKSRFPIGWFTSQEALIEYEDVLNEPLSLSTVSTYLARLTSHGFLSRSGSRVKRRYKIRRKPSVQEKQRMKPLT